MAECCPYQAKCRKYLYTLDIKGFHFESRYDMCYCPGCHKKRGDLDYYERGNPPKTYALPIGWCRFALRVNGPDDKFGSWYRAYHGTRLHAAKTIIHHGRLERPGTAVHGKTVKICNGHFTPTRKPSDWKDSDCYKIFVSPTIKYSGDDCYAKPERYSGDLNVKVAFQVLIAPGFYTSNNETLGLKERLDPKFDNENLEWSTDDPEKVRIYGLLIRIYDNKEDNKKLNTDWKTHKALLESLAAEK